MYGERVSICPCQAETNIDKADARIIAVASGAANIRGIGVVAAAPKHSVEAR
jgi:hypothetical protein